MDRKYFGPIEKKGVLKKQTFIEKPITQTIKATYQDPNIQIPMVVASQNTVNETREARVLDFISSYLSDGRSSKLYKKVVDEKIALQIGAVVLVRKITECILFTAYRWKRILLRIY
jgi:hypothetical protein